jgi:hypothetical protein
MLGQRLAAMALEDERRSASEYVSSAADEITEKSK